MKLKANSHERDKYYLMLDNVLASYSDLLGSITHKGSCVLNATEYNYKLRSVSGQENESKVKKWTWFNKEVRDTFLCLWMTSRKSVDHKNIRRAIGCLLDMEYAPSASMRDSIGSTTSFFHISMVVHPGLDDCLHIRKFIHKDLLTSLSKEQQHGKVSLNNAALQLDYKLSINMLMKKLYIAVRYFYVLNQITLEEDCQAVYAPSTHIKSKCLTKTIDGELIDISKLEMNKMNSTKSIVSKWVIL